MTFETIKRPCADGGDRHCYKEVDARILADLDDDERDDVLQGHDVHMSRERMNNAGIDCNQYEFDEDDTTDVPAEDLVSGDEVCAACGSDQDYDDEGNNITGL